eukprot:scaffold1499_cov111-Isochrysis_galbana.AAC.3
MNRSRRRPSPLAWASHISEPTKYGCTSWNLRRGALLFIASTTAKGTHVPCAELHETGFKTTSERRTHSGPVAAHPPLHLAETVKSPSQVRSSSSQACRKSA